MKTKKKSKITQAERDALAAIGKRGGTTTAKRLGKKGMSALGKRGAAKRWPEKEALE